MQSPKTLVAGEAFRWRPISPNGQLTAPSWRLWTHNDDVYATQRNLAGDWKVSLHATGDFQSSFVATPESEAKWRPQSPDSRHIDAWSRPGELAEGWTQLLHVVHPAREMRPILEAGIDQVDHTALQIGSGWALHVYILDSRRTAVANHLDFERARHVARVHYGDDRCLDVVVVLNPWGYPQVEFSDEARRKMLTGEGKSFVPTDTTIEPASVTTRVLVSGYHADGGRFYMDLAGAPQAGSF
jgi:hypothetical protein